MLLVIDNYDSFTYNLVQYFFELGVEVHVERNDVIDVDGVAALSPSAIVLSPGPGTPDDAGICLDVVSRLGTKVPILGVCLGHQVIAQAYGGRIVHARRVMHGRTSPIEHDGRGVFAGLPSPFVATRYHSLVVARDSVPPELRMTAWTRDATGAIEEIMGLRHRRAPVEGVQFHPEAILTEHGHRLLRNFLERTRVGDNRGDA